MMMMIWAKYKACVEAHVQEKVGGGVRDRLRYLMKHMKPNSK